MSTNYIPFYTEIWADAKFKQLTPSKDNPNGCSKLLFIYLIGNPSIGLTGIYNLDMDICRIKIPIPNFDSDFQEIIESGMVRWDKKEEKIFVINKFKRVYNNKSPTVIEGAARELNLLGHHPFRAEFLEIYATTFKPYKILLERKKDDKDTDLLSEEQVRSFIYDLKWDRTRVKRFYMDRYYSEQKIDEILLKVLPNLK